ncbi:MAG: hypothetical protein PHP70_01970 [Gallionella sp.]|nr:hypothetical protein [Gallionella sp.]
MNKNEFEIRKALIGAQKIEAWVGLAKHALTLGTTLWALKIIIDGLTPFIGQNPEAIEAFAKLVAAINPSNITGYILAGVCGVAWKLERKGKQRANSEIGKLHKILQADDKYRSSSGLTEIGQTPKE